MAKRVVDYKALRQRESAYLELGVPKDKNDDKVLFTAGDQVIVSVKTSSPVDTALSSMGTIQYHGKDMFSVEQYIPIIRTKYTVLDYLPKDEFSWEWLGEDFGKVSRNGMKLTFESDDFLGFLHVSYRVERLLYLLKGLTKNGVRVLIHATNEQDAHDTTYIDVVEPSVLDGKFKVYLVTRKIMTGEVVPGVKVKCGPQDGVIANKGETDDSGRVYLGELEQGTYDLELDPPAPYLHSSEDGISNDRFTI